MSYKYIANMKLIHLNKLMNNLSHNKNKLTIKINYNLLPKIVYNKKKHLII